MKAEKMGARRGGEEEERLLGPQGSPQVAEQLLRVSGHPPAQGSDTQSTVEEERFDPATALITEPVVPTDRWKAMRKFPTEKRVRRLEGEGGRGEEVGGRKDGRGRREGEETRGR